MGQGGHESKLAVKPSDRPHIVTLSEVEVDPGDHQGKKSRFEKSSILSKLTFRWASPILAKGAKGAEDYLELNDADRASRNFAIFERNWNEEITRNPSDPSLLRALKKSFGKEMFVAGCWKGAWASLVILAAFYFVRFLFVYVRDRSDERNPNKPGPSTGWPLAVFFFVNCFMLCCCLQQLAAKAMQVGIKVRAALMTAVYRKSLRIPNVGSEVGDVVSLISNDCARLMDGCTFFHYLWAGPAEAIAIVVCMCTMIGVKALPSIGVLAVLFLLQFGIGAKVVKNRSLNIATTDQRVQVVNEALQSIKTIKMYAWEKQFGDLVAEIRKRELKLMKVNGTIKSINILSVFGTPPTIAVVVFATWIFSEQGTKFNGEYVFTMLTLFNTLRLPMSFLPKAIKGLSESLAALERIGSFLKRPDVEPLKDRGVVGITMNNAAFSFGSPEPIIRNISMDLPRGKLLGLVGPVGCGKSTLLNAVLGETKTLSGSISVGGTLAYVPQAPWIQFGTVRSNILFGKPFEDYKYRHVVYACALERDMEILGDGDETEIGERGINLSGGQRQRIALARAVYSDHDVMLLDNPLSAVDQHTCKHIFGYCIKDILVASGKTVILVTHQLELLEQCDYVGIMKDGLMDYYGPYRYDVVASHFPQWAEQQEKVKQQHGGGEEKKEVEVKRVARPKDHVPGKKSVGATGKMVKEDTSSGRLNFFQALQAFGLWINAMGKGTFTLSILWFILAQISRTAGDYWLTIWTAADTGNPRNKIPLDPNYTMNYNNVSKDIFMIIYAIFLVVFWALMYLRGIWFYRIALSAATRLHNNMFRKVLRAPMEFFNKTPLGRLLACVSKDMDIIDEALPDAFMLSTIYMFILLVTLCFVTGVLYYFAIVSVILVVGFFLLNSYYLKTTRILKGISGNTAGPIYAHLAETLTGIAVIRGFRVQDQFKSDNIKRIDRNHKAVFNLEMCQLWASHRLDWLGSLLVFSVAAFAVIFDPAQTGFTAGNFGFAVSNSFQMLLFFTAFVRGTADIESMLGAVERVKYYTDNIPEEAPLVLPNCRPAESWPAKGEIDFKDVVMRYAKELDPAMRGVSFKVEHGEKVGIVGRTGAGKSTSLLALFRLYECDSGTIIVDGQNVSQFGLHDIRARFGILPQEPVMFKGTIRSNLDPFEQHNDQELWVCLEKSYLKDSIDSLPLKLDTPVEEGGANFSLGQKQLFCLARAILKKPRILCLDEATAAMDLETDAKIQQAIQREFVDSTVLTIAHRLDTIITSDKILVMDAGKVAEFDNPVTLLNNPESSFYKLCANVGHAGAEALRAQAIEYHRSKAATHGLKDGGKGPVTYRGTSPSAHNGHPFGAGSSAH
eukprot:tig00000158_g10189.t1